MKSLILFLAALSFTIAHAEHRISSVQIVVDSVKCRSGAEVNFEETVSPGSTFHVAEVPPEFKPVDKGGFDQRAIFRLDYTINNETGYKSGRPPCPLADVLEIEVMIRRCEFIVQDDLISSRFECGDYEKKR